MSLRATNLVVPDGPPAVMDWAQPPDAEIARQEENIFPRISEAAEQELNQEAQRHILRHMAACDAVGDSYDLATLSSNLEANFPEITPHNCKKLAMDALEPLLTS